jgi:hypothetical protein
VKEEIERSAKRQRLIQLEKNAMENKTALQLEQEAAEAMLAEYQKKMSVIAEKRKEIENEEKKIAARLKSHDTKLLQNTINMASKRTL